MILAFNHNITHFIVIKIILINNEATFDPYNNGKCNAFPISFKMKVIQVAIKYPKQSKNSLSRIMILVTKLLCRNPETQSFYSIKSIRHFTPILIQKIFFFNFNNNEDILRMISAD